MGAIPTEDSILVAFTGSFSIWHWLIVLAVVLILFGGGGKIPKLMKDLGSGITQFKRGMKEEDKSEGEEEDDGEKPALNRDETSTAQSEKVDEDKKQKAANG